MQYTIDDLVDNVEPRTASERMLDFLILTGVALEGNTQLSDISYDMEG